MSTRKRARSPRKSRVITFHLDAGDFRKMGRLLHHLINGEGPFSDNLAEAAERIREKMEVAYWEASERPFAVQLELATALVEVVHELDAKPGPSELAEARRRVSMLHQSLHTEEAFKIATA